MKKILIYAFILLFTLFYFTFLLSTQTGLNLSLYFAKLVLRENFSYQNPTGRLIGPLNFSKIHYLHKNFSVQGENVALDWHPLQILRNPIAFHYFNAERLIINKQQTKIEIRKIALNIQAENPNELIRGFIDGLKISQNQQALLELKKIEIKATGKLEDYHLISSSQLTVKDLPKALVKLEGHGNQKRIDFNQIQLNTTSGTINASGFFSWKPKLDWNFIILTKNIELQELNRKFVFFQTLFKDIYDPQGKVTANMTWSHQINHQMLKGLVELKQGSFRIPALKTQVKNVNLKLQTNKQGNVLIEGMGYTDGRLNLKGQYNFVDSALKLKLTGNQIKIINSDDFKIIASSSNLLLTGQNHQLHLEGDVFIPSALIKPAGYSEGSVNLSDDVVILADDLGQEGLNTRFFAKLRLIAGDDVNLEVKGLTGKIKGTLVINYIPDEPLTATGQLTIIEGKYSIYGQTLELTRGKLSYNHATLDNPTVDIEATRILSISRDSTRTSTSGPFSIPTNVVQTNQINVGIHVVGTLKQPKISLFSQPNIYNQSDILSLILFGKTADQLTHDNGRTLIQAASNLNLGGNSMGQITQQVQDTLGLDQLDIQSTSVPYSAKPSQTTSLVLGKNIGRHLFLSYSIGLLDPIKILNVSYIINNNWSLQTQTSTINSGIDLFYSIEP